MEVLLPFAFELVHAWLFVTLWVCRFLSAADLMMCGFLWEQSV